jgi:hypothetical protein
MKPVHAKEGSRRGNCMGSHEGNEGSAVIQIKR